MPWLQQPHFLHENTILNFPVNLLSISQVKKQLNCKVTFFPSYYVFKDLAYGKMIGAGREVGGIYVLTQSPRSSPYALYVVVSSTQWNYCLGHVPPSLLQHLGLPSVSSRPLACKSCQLGKHHRVSFLTQINNVCSQPFALVHYDI